MADDKTLEAIEDLRQLLHLSQEASQRLKHDIPSDNFPDAYQLHKTIRSLRKVVEQLRQNLDPSATELTMQFFEADMLSSSDSMAGL